MPASELIERVSTLMATRAPASLQADCSTLERRLREPVRVAIVGPVNSGKSTLVNALLGQRVAPTNKSECTRLVTWFRYGHPQRVEVETADGIVKALPLSPDGLLPETLGVPVETVKGLHCYLANDSLKDVTLVDTPGLGSVHADYSASTTELLALSADSSEAARRADAIVFLFNQAVMQDDYAALQLFKEAGGADSLQSAANAVGVLSKADQLGDPMGDPWAVAVELADQYAGRFEAEVASVVPLIGLVAETSEAAALIERDVQHLAKLAEMDEKAFNRLVWSTDRFASASAPVEPEDRERLLDLLDMYGVKRAVGFLRDGVKGAIPLRRELSAISGISQVKRSLMRFLGPQDHVLKVRSVLDSLERSAYAANRTGHPEIDTWLADIEQLRLEPALHPVYELEVLHRCYVGKVQMTPEMLAEMAQLFAPGTTSNRLGLSDASTPELLAAAKDGMNRWQTFRVTRADPGQAAVARVVIRSYQILWKELQ
jgi:energy-coupling factor transporter ATP-binding protein EcfA2